MLPQLPRGTEVYVARPYLFGVSLPSPAQAPSWPPNRPRLCSCLSVSGSCPRTWVTHSIFPVQALSGRGADVAVWVIGSRGTPVMGRKAHVIFREFQEIFGSRHPTIRHKESIVRLPSPFCCAQVINTDSSIVKDLAGRVCSLQGLTTGAEMEGQTLPHFPVLTFCLVPSRCPSS